jgi:hypothetical protein
MVTTIIVEISSWWKTWLWEDIEEFGMTHAKNRFLGLE